MEFVVVWIFKLHNYFGYGLYALRSCYLHYDLRTRQVVYESMYFVDCYVSIVFAPC